MTGAPVRRRTGPGFTGAGETFREDGAIERSTGSMGSEYRSFHIDPGGPAARPASTVLPLCTPDFVLEALELAVDGRIRELDALIDRRAGDEARVDAGGYAEPLDRRAKRR